MPTDPPDLPDLIEYRARTVIVVGGSVYAQPGDAVRAADPDGELWRLLIEWRSVVPESDFDPEDIGPMIDPEDVVHERAATPITIPKSR